MDNVLFDRERNCSHLEINTPALTANVVGASRRSARKTSKRKIPIAVVDVPVPHTFAGRGYAHLFGEEELAAEVSGPGAEEPNSTCGPVHYDPSTTKIFRQNADEKQLYMRSTTSLGGAAEGRRNIRRKSESRACSPVKVHSSLNCSPLRSSTLKGQKRKESGHRAVRRARSSGGINCKGGSKKVRSNEINYSTCALPYRKGLNHTSPIDPNHSKAFAVCASGSTTNVPSKLATFFSKRGNHGCTRAEKIGFIRSLTSIPVKLSSKSGASDAKRHQMRRQQSCPVPNMTQLSRCSSTQARSITHEARSGGVPCRKQSREEPLRRHRESASCKTRSPVNGLKQWIGTDPKHIFAGSNKGASSLHSCCSRSSSSGAPSHANIRKPLIGGMITGMKLASAPVVIGKCSTVNERPTNSPIIPEAATASPAAVASRFERSNVVRLSRIGSAADTLSSTEGAAQPVITPLPLSMVLPDRHKQGRTKPHDVNNRAIDPAGGRRRGSLAVHSDAPFNMRCKRRGPSALQRKPRSTPPPKSVNGTKHRLPRHSAEAGIAMSLKETRNGKGPAKCRSVSEKPVKCASRASLRCLPRGSVNKIIAVSQNEPIFPGKESPEEWEDNGRELTNTKTATRVESPSKAQQACCAAAHGKEVVSWLRKSAAEREPICVTTPTCHEGPGCLPDTTPYGNKEEEENSGNDFWTPPAYIGCQSSSRNSRRIMSEKLSSLELAISPVAQLASMRRRSRKSRSSRHGPSCSDGKEADHEAYAEMLQCSRTTVQHLSSYCFTVSVSTLTAVSMSSRSSARVPGVSVRETTPQDQLLRRGDEASPAVGASDNRSSAAQSPQEIANLLATTGSTVPASPRQQATQQHSMARSFSTRCSFQAYDTDSSSPEPQKSRQPQLWVNYVEKGGEEGEIQKELEEALREQQSRQGQKATAPVLNFCRTNGSERVVYPSTPSSTDDLRQRQPRNRRPMINTTKHTLQRTPLGTTLMVQSPSHPCTDSNESNGERYSNSRSSRMRTPTPQGRASRARSASSTPSLTKSQVSPCRKMVESCIVANSFGRGAADDTNKAAQDPQLLHGTVENTSKARNLRPVQIFTSSSAAPSQAEGPARQRRRTWSVERIATCKPGKVSYFSRTSSHYFSSSTSSHCSSAGNGQSSSKRHAAWTADPQHGAMSGESRLIQRRVVNLA